MKPFARNSLATGPKIRVPTGSPELANKTALFSSKRTVVSSILFISLIVRTITARMTSPFFTLECGMASLTDTTIMSPTRAYLLRVPPSTRIHKTFFAPELSATSSTVSVCIISSPTNYIDCPYRISTPGRFSLSSSYTTAQRTTCSILSQRLCNDFTYPPSFSLTQWPAFLNHDPITDVTSTSRIISHVLHALMYKFTVEFMAHFPVDLNNNTLIHFVADH